MVKDSLDADLIETVDFVPKATPIEVPTTSKQVSAVPQSQSYDHEHEDGGGNIFLIILIIIVLSSIYCSSSIFASFMLHVNKTDDDDDK